MSLNTLLTTAAVNDPVLAGQLCDRLSAAAAAAKGDIGAADAGLMAQLQPDLQDAVLATAANHPKGCQPGMAGELSWGVVPADLHLQAVSMPCTCCLVLAVRRCTYLCATS